MSIDAGTRASVEISKRELEAAGINPFDNVSQMQMFEQSKALGLEIGALRREIDEMRKQISGLRDAVDHADKSLHFAGDWQSESYYEIGAVVRHGNAVYTALCHISPRAMEPGGGHCGWTCLAKGA